MQRLTGRRIAPWIVLGSLVSTCTALVWGAAPASAATVVTVTTTADVVDGDDGVTSLREAVDAANAAADEVTIQLAPAATYTLALCDVDGSFHPSNATGRLYLERVGTTGNAVTIDGNGATLDQACDGEAHIIDAREQDGASLTITDLTLTGANHPDTMASSIGTVTDLTLERVEITGNAHIPNLGFGFGGLWDATPAAVVSDGDGSLTIVDSSISDNRNSAAISAVQSGGQTTITNSQFVDNDGNETVGAIHAWGRPLTITNSVITDNHARDELVPTTAPTDPSIYDNDNQFGAVVGTHVTADHVTIERNGATFGGGIFAANLYLTDSTIRHNSGFVGGGVAFGAGTIDRTLITENTALAGAGVDVFACKKCDAPARIERSTLFGNVGGSGVGVWIDSSDGPDGTPTTISRSTITGNRGYTGAGVELYEAGDPVRLEESTVVGNLLARWSDEPVTTDTAEVYESSGGDVLSVRNSVIAATDPGLQSCTFEEGTPASLGHNFDADGTCGLSDPTDVSNGGDPLLGSLSDNGGATPTMLPQPRSLLLDQIPASAAGCSGTVAQNELARPQGPACDIGASERRLGGYHPVTPTRVLDSRGGTGGWSAPIGARQSRQLQIPGLPAHTDAVVLNVTVTGGSAPSHLTIWPTGTVRPTASTVNWSAGQTVANSATVPVGTGNTISVFNNAGNVDVVVDIVGWFDDGELTGQTCPCGAALNATDPQRVLDTRTGLGGITGPIGPGATAVVDLLPDAVTAPSAAVVNITAVSPTASTHVTAWASNSPMPATSNLNLPAGDVRANLAFVPVAPDGTIKIRNNSGSTQVVIDVYAWFAPSGDRFRAITPQRVLDSRDGTGGWPGALGPGATGTIPPGALPAGTAVVGNLTAVFPTAATHLSLYPTGPLPDASTINVPAGDVRANQVLVANGPGISIRNNAGTTHTILDLTGYFG